MDFKTHIVAFLFGKNMYSMQFWIVVNYFVLGVKKYTENDLEKSLMLLTTPYVVEEPP